MAKTFNWFGKEEVASKPMFKCFPTSSYVNITEVTFLRSLIIGQTFDPISKLHLVFSINLCVNDFLAVKSYFICLNKSGTNFDSIWYLTHFIK